MPDNVNKPSHYNFGKYEVIDVLEDWFPETPLLWNAVKYIARWNKKGNNSYIFIENLKKSKLLYSKTN